MPNSKATRRLLAAGLTTLAIIAVLLGVSWKFATGGRTFFSPDTLDTRSQTEVLLFQTPVPIYRSTFSYHRYELVDFLIEEGYWTPAPTEQPVWLPTNHWNRQWNDGQSLIHREFAWFAGDWIAWTQANPDLASDLWPLVLDELRSDTPDCQTEAYRLMWSAEMAEDVEAFEEFRR